MICDRCYRPTDQGEHGLYLCPLEPRRAHVVWQDSIEGGLTIEHGLCNDDGTPRTYYSKSEMRQAAAIKGVVPWGDIYTEDRTKDGRVYNDWLRSGEAQRAKQARTERRMDGERMPAPPRPHVPLRAPRPETRRIAIDVMRSLR